MEDSGQDDRREKLASRIRDFIEKVHSWENYDEREEIHAYCDDLEGEVLKTFESEVKRLEHMRDDNLDEIKKYRADLLEKLNGRKTDRYLAIQDNVNKTLKETLIPAANHAKDEILPVLLRGDVDEKLLEFQSSMMKFYDNWLNSISSSITWLAFQGQQAQFKPDNLFSLMFASSNIKRFEMFVRYFRSKS